MPKSTKEKPEFDDTAYHFPTFFIYQQFHNNEIDLPKDFLPMLQQNKKVVKSQIKIWSHSITFTEKKKREVAIYRIRRYLTTEKDNIIILLINGLDKETASYDAFRFKNKETGDLFIKKLAERQKALKNDEDFNTKVVQPYYRSSIPNLAGGTDDNQSIATKNSLYRQLSDDDFSTFGRKKGSQRPNFTDVTRDVSDDRKTSSKDNYDDRNIFKKDYSNENSYDRMASTQNDYDAPGYDYYNKNYRSINPIDIPVVNSAPKEPNYNTMPTTAPTIKDAYGTKPNMILADSCDMSKVHAPEYGRFPYNLPSNLSSDLETQRLQYTGEFRVYEKDVEFFDKHSKEVLFRAPYDEIKNIHEFSHQPTNLLVFRDDKVRRVSQMVLLNFDSRKATKNATNIFKNNKVDVFQYIPKEDAIPESSMEGLYNVPIEPSNLYSQNNANTWSSFTSEPARFDSMKIRKSFSRPRINSLHDEEELKRLPDDGKWNYDLVYLNDDPENGSIVSDTGSVYMFVAHKLNTD